MQLAFTCLCRAFLAADPHCSTAAEDGMRGLRYGLPALWQLMWTEPLDLFRRTILLEHPKLSEDVLQSMAALCRSIRGVFVC